MRFAEIYNNRVHYVLPVEMEADYKILPPNCIEIGKFQDVTAGDILEIEVDLDNPNIIIKNFRRPTEDEILAPYKIEFRQQRDKLFAETQWARERHADRIEQGIDDKTNWAEWQNYWQTLRDLPTMENFDYRNITYPEKPR